MDDFGKASVLAIGLAQDPSLRIRRGRWAYNPAAHVLHICAGHVKLPDPQEQGLIGHEISHALISLYHHFDLRGDLPPPILANLLNAIEDPRVNAFFCRRYPGGSAWMEAVYAADRATQLPPTQSLFLQFNAAASIADAWDWQIPRCWSLDQRVIAALRVTNNARRRYATRILPGDEIDRELADADLSAHLRHEVEPLLGGNLQGPQPVTRAATLALISAARAHRLFQTQIFPVVSRLIVRDLSSLSARARKDPRFRRALATAMVEGSPGLTEMVEQALASEGSAEPDTLEHQAFVAFLAGRQGAPAR